MKYHSLIIWSIYALLVSCSIQEAEVTAPKDTEEPEFYASIEDESSRGYVDNQLRVLWNADDRVSIFNKNTTNQEYCFTGKDGDNSGSFNIVSGTSPISGNSLDLVYSVYPYQESTSISKDGVISITLPAVQTYKENSFGLGANTMVAVANDNELMYRNLCGYLAIKLYGDNIAISSLTIKGNNNEPLAGNATVNASIDGVPALSFDSSATNSIKLTSESPVTLGTTAETATTFWFVVPPVIFSKGFRITVTDPSGGAFGKMTKKTITIDRNTLSKMSPMYVEITEPDPEGVVDLGLSVKWASCNLGASAPEECGNKYAWGETEAKKSFSWQNYRWCNGSENNLTKYCTDSQFGNVDNKITLDLEDDAAYVALGGKWRMPTVKEVKELIDNCTWEWVSNDSFKGFYAISKLNGERVFFPVEYTSNADYLSSSLYVDHTYYKYQEFQINALSLYFSGDPAFMKGWVALQLRYDGAFIRPVYGMMTVKPVTGITLDKHELTIPVGRTKEVSATISPDDASDKLVLWGSSDPSVASVNAGSITAISVGSCTITATAHDNGIVERCNVTVVPKSDPSFYSSTDFSKDGEIVLLQKATVGKGINLILLGDGYVDKDMVTGGLFEQKANQAMEHFFSYEPYRTFRNRFNFYCVKVVSVNKEYGSEQSDRAITYEQDGKIYFRNNLCLDYARTVPNPYNQRLNVAVLFNSDRYVARSFCNMALSEDGYSLAYLMDIDENLINHELGGHGFAFLADEYEEYGGAFTEQSLLDRRYEMYGYGANVDWRNNRSTVRWSAFLNDSRYSAEGLGIYEGAYLYPKGIYRSTPNSVMRNHYLSTGKSYNAPSREQIYKTIMRYSEGDSWSYDYEAFVAADAAGREQAISVFKSSSSYAPLKSRQKEFSDNHMPPIITDQQFNEICIDKDGTVRLIN